MFLGRGVLLGYLAKKKLSKQKQEQKPKNYKLIDHQTKFTKAISKQQYYFLKKYPWSGWFLGCVLIGISQWINVILIQHRHIFLDDIEGLSYPAKFAVSISITLVGLIFLACSEIISLEVNKKLSLLFLEKRTIFGRRSIISRNLKKLQSITILKRGHESIETNTIHYVLLVSFEREKDIEILEQNSLMDIRKKYVEIMTYLERPIDFEGNFPFEDQSTGKSQDKKSKAKKKPANTKDAESSKTPLLSNSNNSSSQQQQEPSLMITQSDNNINEQKSKQMDITDEIKENNNNNNQKSFEFSFSNKQDNDLQHQDQLINKRIKIN